MVLVQYIELSRHHITLVTPWILDVTGEEVSKEEIGGEVSKEGGGW